MDRQRLQPAVSLAHQSNQLRHKPTLVGLRASAIRFDQLVRDGAVRDQTELAQRLHVPQQRTSQIMNLLHLAADIQEASLFLPRTMSGRDPIYEKRLRPIAAELDWGSSGECGRL